MRRAAGCAAAGLLLVLVGLLFDAPPVYVPGVAFVALGVAVPAWMALAARGAQVRRQLEARRAVEGEPVPVQIEVRVPRLPLASVAVVDPLLPAPLRVPVGARTRTFDAHVQFARRGRRRLEPPSLVLRDPLDLVRRRVRGRGTPELLVLPRTEPVVLGPDGAASDGSARTSAAALTQVSEVDGLRPYREGTPAARIHWQSLARGAGLMERRLRDDGDARPLVVLDPRGAAVPEDLDAAVRAAASLCLVLARDGGCALLLPGDRRPATLAPQLVGWPAAHARLALVEDDGRAPVLTAAAGRRGPLLYVAARPLERLPAATRGLQVLVVPGDLDGRAAAFTVAGCSGYLLGRRGAGAVAA